MQKWGRSSPLRSFARVQNQRPSKTQPQCSLQCPFTEEVNGTLNRRVNGVFHAPFTFPRQKRALNFIGILAPLSLQRPQKQKSKRQIATSTVRVSGFHRFLILVCGPVRESSAHLHPSKQLDISVNSPHILRGPPKRKTSLRIFVICHFSFGDQPTRRLPPAVPGGTTFVCAVHLRALQTAIEAL